MRNASEPALPYTDETARKAAAPAASPRVAEIAAPAVTLPAWFSSAQACAVLQLKMRSFVLVTGTQGVDRVASRAQLAAAPAEQSVLRSSVPLGPVVTPSTSVAEALRLMDADAVDHAALMVGRAVLGIVTREAAVLALVLGAARPRLTVTATGTSSAHQTERLAA